MHEKWNIQRGNWRQEKWGKKWARSEAASSDFLPRPRCRRDVGGTGRQSQRDTRLYLRSARRRVTSSRFQPDGLRVVDPFAYGRRGGGSRERYVPARDSPRASARTAERDGDVSLSRVRTLPYPEYPRVIVSHDRRVRCDRSRARYLRARARMTRTCVICARARARATQNARNNFSVSVILIDPFA